MRKIQAGESCTSCDVADQPDVGIRESPDSAHTRMTQSTHNLNK